ncbi:hypothetical protein DYB36_001754 [Aphanomyces astaci]|uniref:Eis-like acetyltransferase domain-containing protein n=1 Tax=Aphanomyces astaci TaxID=112090 RepID=A0A397AYM9_APHAT|nr:hypothetical protein DYB36_001754 [Aphanomyces astaci]
MDDVGSTSVGKQTRDVCDVDGCKGMTGVVVRSCQRDLCPHVVHLVCAVDILHCTENSYFCSPSCQSMPSTKVVPGVEFTTFEALQTAIREDGARFGVKINQRQTHLMDDRALVIFGHKSIQRGVFYCSQLHCPYTLRFSFDFGKMRYSIRHTSFHGAHNHGIKNTMHARGKGIPFDHEFTSMDALPDGIERFQCRHCRSVVLKRASRLTHLKDCQPYRAHLGLDQNDEGDDREDGAGGGSINHERPGSSEFRYIPSTDGQTSSRLECKHCGAHLNPKTNRLLTHLRDCAAYQGGDVPLTNMNAAASSNVLDDALPPSGPGRSSVSRLDCRPLHPDTDIRSALGHPVTAPVRIVEPPELDRRFDHWGLFDPTRPAKRLRSGVPATPAPPAHLVGHFSVQHLDMNIGGVRVPVGAMHSLTTDWLHTGTAPAALSHFLHVCHSQNHAIALVPAAILHDTATSARAMGFTALPPWFQHIFPKSALLLSQDATYPPHLLSVLDDDDDGNDVIECLARVGASSHGRLFRSCDTVASPSSLCHRRVVGCRDLRGTLRGYFVYNLHPSTRTLTVHDIVYEDMRILSGLLGFLATQDGADTIALSTPDPHFPRLLRHPPTSTSVNHPPPLLARIVHVGHFLATHMSARNFNYATGIVLQLLVQDTPTSGPPHSSNTSLVLRFDGGLVRVQTPTPVDAFDARLQLDLEALTALMLGAVPLAKLLQLGQATLTPSDPRTSRLVARAFEVDDVPATRMPHWMD